MNPTLCISIVSHGQLDLISELLNDLSCISFCGFSKVSIVLTLNIPEDEYTLQNTNLPLIIIRNPIPLGFGHNHNNAFKNVNCDYFLILNPDIRIKPDFCFSNLYITNPNWGCMGPLVFSKFGNIEDSAREFPTIRRILKRVFLRIRTNDYSISPMSESLLSVDWVGGMFILFKADVFKSLDGFNLKYFMYLEDADICKRVHSIGYDVVINPRMQVVHDARRNSLKNWKHFKWHFVSLFRFIFNI